MKKFKSAFTISEMVAVLVILGILVLLTINNFLSFKVDKRKMMFRKAYAQTEKIVAQLLNDARYYPYSTDTDKAGFRNKDVKDSEGNYLLLPEGASIQIEGKDPYTTLQGENLKFSLLFASNLNILGNVKQKGHALHFTTTDGINWIVPNTNFEDGIATITIDTNGEAGPNSKKDRTDIQKRDKDIFEIIVYYTGKVTVRAKSLESDFLFSQSPEEESIEEGSLEEENLEEDLAEEESKEE